MSNLTVPGVVALLTILWWCWYFLRLWGVVRNGYFLHMPRFYLCLNLYGVGLFYYLAQYEPEQQLQAALAWTHLSVVSILIALISSGLISWGYIIVVRRYTRFTISHQIDRILAGVILVTIFTSLVLYNRVPYVQLQVIVNVLLTCGNLLSAWAILPMVRVLLQSQQNPIRDAHHRWLTLYLIACGCAAACLLLDGVVKLWTVRYEIYTPLYLLSVVFQNAFMLLVAMLIAPDQYLDWIYYPRFWRIWRRLKTLIKRIHRETSVRSIYNTPMPRVLTLSALKFNIYQQFIVIMDTYPHLPDGSSLGQALNQIVSTCASREEMIWKMQWLVDGGQP